MFVVIHIFNEDTNSAFKMAWIIPVLIIPIFGTMIYVFVNLQLGTKIMRSRLASIDKQLHEKAKTSDVVLEKLKSELHGERGLASYLHNAGDFPAYYDNDIEFFPLGEFKFEEMKKQLMAAEKFIFMEYFIVTDSYMWRSILDILKLKASQGVEVRFMYDGMCSLALLPYGYYKELENMGIKSRPFSQIKPVLSTVQNNRDHRKITVIDGRVAYTGGMNLADEYINARVRFGYWKDAAIRLTGECVWSFTSMFLELWDYILKTESDYTFYRATSMEKHRLQEKIHADEKGFVQPYTDSPLDHEDVGENVYLNMISRAKKYLYIFTPYLIIGSEMRTALVNAAKSGVDVRLVVPGIPDKKLVYFLTQSNFPYLIKNGVKIYTYTPGFIHAKCFVSDDVQATVGTVNLDYRSLCLHFECGVWMYRTRAVLQVKEDALKTFAESHEVTLEEFQKKSFLVRTFMGALKLFAPLL